MAFVTKIGADFQTISKYFLALIYADLKYTFGGH